MSFVTRTGTASKVAFPIATTRNAARMVAAEAVATVPWANSAIGPARVRLSAFRHAKAKTAETTIAAVAAARAPMTFFVTMRDNAR